MMNLADPHNDPHCFQIMGRIHVGTPDAEALLHAMKSLRDPSAVEPRALFYYAARCLTAHHLHRQQYADVMGGRI